MALNDTSRVLTIGESCERLRISRPTFYKLLDAKRIQSFKIGSRRLVPVDAIDAFIADELGE